MEPIHFPHRNLTPQPPLQPRRRPSPFPHRIRYRKSRQTLIQRVRSTLRHRRSALHTLYTNALIEMAESKLHLPHEGGPGLLYAVSEIPSGHSRQSLIDGFDDVVASMSASTSKSSSENSWATSREGHAVDLLTGNYHRPEDFDQYRTRQPLRPRSIHHQAVRTDGEVSQPAELSWSPPWTPSRASNVSLIDLDTPPDSGPPTPPNPPNGQFSHVDELFFGGLDDALKTPAQTSGHDLASLDAALFPQPLGVKESPYPEVPSPQTTPKQTLQKRAVHGNLRLDTQHPALLQPSWLATTSVPTPLRTSRRIPRKPVPWTPNPTSYHPYRPALPSPHLPQLSIPATDSLLEEMNSAIDLVMTSFSPANVLEASTQRTPTQRIPLIPPRTTSRTAPTSSAPPPLPTSTSSNPHASSSFRSRLGASTLNALLLASSAVSPSLSPLTPTPAEMSGWQWQRWVDRAGDVDSETEERACERRWRERKRREGGDGSKEGGG